MSHETKQGFSAGLTPTCEMTPLASGPRDSSVMVPYRGGGRWFFPASDKGGVQGFERGREKSRKKEYGTGAGQGV